MDLNFCQKSLANIKFENEDLINMVVQKINNILTAKCGIKDEEIWSFIFSSYSHF